MFFLVSNVVLVLSGSFFEKWGMAFSKHGKSAGVSECEVISAEPVIEDFDKKKACIVLPEVWLGGPLPQRPQPPRKEQKVIMGYVSLTIYREFPASKFLRALPYRACGTRCSGPPGYFPRLAISSSAPAALRRGCIIIRFFAIHPLFACSENSMVSGGGVFAVFPKYAILGE